MKIIAAVLLLLTAPLAAQSIAPSQIKPGTNGQSLQTVAGKAAWGDSSTSVSSVFGRTGVIVPVTGDYNCSQITSAICALPSLFNQTVEVDGAAQTQRAKLNFLNGSAGTVTCVDNPVTLATDCTFTGGASAGITYSIADVTGSRAVNTAYQNTTGSVMFVGGSVGTSGSGTGNILVAQGPGGSTPPFSLPFVDWANQATATVSSGDAGFSATIMPGYWYMVQTSGAVNGGVHHWTQITSTGSGGGGGGFTAAGDLSGTSSSQTVIGLDGIPFCSGFTPTNAQFIQLTTGGSPNPCYTAASASGSGNTTSTSLTTNRIPKANGANSIIDSSVSDNGTTVSTTEPLTAPAVNTVINAGSSLSAAVTACGSAQTTIQITQTIAVGTGITVPANCTLLFQSAGNLTGTSIVIHGKVISPAVQIFGAGLAVTGMTGAAYPEWFGAKAYPLNSSVVATAAAAANDATAAAATIAAIAGNGWMELRCYAYHFDTVSVTTSNTGIVGECPSYVIGSSVGTVIVSNSAGGNIVSAQGASAGSLISYVRFEGFSVQRAVTPTGTAAGVYGQYVDNWTVKNVQSGDSIYGLYSNDTPSSTNGGIFGFGALWGFSVVSASALPSGMQGIFLDSANGNAESSISIVGGQVACQNSGAKAGGILASGISVTDFYISKVSVAGCNIGIDLENTGTSGFVAQDVLLTDNILNGCLTNCLKINGMQSTTDIAPHVYVSGGDMFATGTGAVGALIENSSNIALTNVQMFVGSVGSAAQTDVVLNTVNGFQVNDNDFSGASLINISCISSTNGTIVGNKIKNENGTTGSTGIKNVGCTNIVEQGNTLSGIGAGGLLNGITFDATSSGNGPWSLNTIDSATVTTPVTDAGTNNNVMKPTALIAGTVTDSALTAGQQVVAGASGLLSNGGTAILSCADTSASGTAQSCTTSSSFTPAANSCVLYTTTTANSGTGLTLNVNSLGAKSVAKWLGTTTLAAGDVAANSPQMACYNGTVWNLSTIGNAPSGGGGSITFPQTVAGTVNSGGLVYANSGTQVSVSPAGTAGQAVLWGGAGAAPTAQAIGTSGAVIPLLNGANTYSGASTFSATGAASTSGLTFTGAPFTGGSGTTTFPYVYINNGATGPTTFSTAGTEFGINAPSGFTGNFFDLHLNGGISLASIGSSGAFAGRSFSANGGVSSITNTGYAMAGAFESMGAKFTTSGCSVSSTTGGSSAGIFTLGANSCTVVLTIGTGVSVAAPNGWTCAAHDRTAPTVLIGGESSSTTTTASITIPAGAGTTDVISFACIAF